MSTNKIISLLTIGIIYHSVVIAQIDSGKPKTDSAKSSIIVSGKPKPYKDVITSKSVTERGLFTIHKVEDHYYFEIPDSIIDRDILVVNRISKGAAEGRAAYWGMAGDEIGGNQIKFSKGPNNKLFIKRISFWERSNDSSANGMYKSLKNSTLLPIIASFDIKAFSPDSASVIDVTDYLNSENDVFFFSVNLKNFITKIIGFPLGNYQTDKSYIEEIRSYPLNVEIKTIKTYSKDNQSSLTFTYEFNSSVVLLPKVLMKPRYIDARIGYFHEGYQDYDANPERVENTQLITRWRLEPKEEDIEKYKRGTLVEPKKPIVYYIDPATPKKWVPYLIQGVNDWQKAFEKAGFKNAIYALEAPINDPEWSLEDARHNAIVYKPSYIENASGPHVHDPRTGEILETHINWYHNVMDLIHNWYMIQASPSDPRARKMEFDEELMGQLIRFVCSHEVGHTLGLLHNFGASSTIPVDSLRSKQYVEENGFCPSIMDYARFNYVAQPEDHVSEKGLFPRIGVYDEFAIEFGYRWLPELKSKEQEKNYMNKWIIERLKKDKRLYFGNEYGGDPRNQSEDLGDDAIKAGYYGIKNLKFILPHLKEWTTVSNEMLYKSYSDMYKELINQYYRYLGHVAENVGSRMGTWKTIEQPGAIIEFTSRQKQKEAIQFLQNELFSTPEWLIDKKIFPIIGGAGMFTPFFMQKEILQKIMSYGTFTGLFWNQGQEPDKSYTVNELLSDLETGIWKELKTGSPIDIYRRNLQKIYASQLIITLSTNTEAKTSMAEAYDAHFYGQFQNNTDLLSIIKDHINKIFLEINRAIPKYKDEITRWHLIDVRNRLLFAINPNTPINSNFLNNNPLGLDIKEAVQVNLLSEKTPHIPKGCWGANSYLK